MKMNTLQKLYWESQSIHDKLFSLEHRMRRLTRDGKNCVRTQEKYFKLLDALREINASMLLLEDKTA